MPIIVKPKVLDNRKWLQCSSFTFNHYVVFNYYNTNMNNEKFFPPYKQNKGCNWILVIEDQKDSLCTHLKETELSFQWCCQSRRPSSTSSSSSSSNNFKRRAYCSSRFFFCHNLKRKNENNPTATSPINMMTTLVPVLLFALDFVFELFFELVESSEKPEKRKQIGAN